MQPRLRLVESATPWTHETDYASESSGVFHLIAVRDDARQFWHGYVGMPDAVLLQITKAGVSQVKCHGGAPIYAGALTRAGGRSKYTYFGFRCDKPEDFSPKDFNARSSRRGPEHQAWFEGKTYRTLEYVQEQCREIVAQLETQRSWPRRFQRAVWRFFFR
jgi:hypothetical protein